MKTAVIVMGLILAATTALAGSSNERQETKVESKIFDLFGAHSNNEVFWQGTGKRINSSGKSLQVNCFATIGDGSFSTGEKHNFQFNTEKYLLRSGRTKPAPQYYGDNFSVPTYSNMYKEYLKPYSLAVNENAHGISVVRKFGTFGGEVLKFAVAKDAADKLAVQISHKKGLRLQSEFRCQGMSPITKAEYVKGLSGIAR